MLLTNILRQRAYLIFLTSPLIGLLITTPIFLSTGFSTERFIKVIFMMTAFSLVSWLIAIFLDFYLPASINKTFAKWFIGTFIMVALLFLYHSLMQHSGSHSEDKGLLRIVNSTAVYSIIFVINLLVTTQEKALQLAAENNQLKISHLEAQLAQLRTQINPHFLFNALASLKVLFRKDAVAAEEYLLKLSDFLRKSIQPDKQLVSLKEELQLCNDYIELQQVRFHEAIRYDVSVGTHFLSYQIPYFSVQSLLENAIKHNIVSQSNPLQISVSINDGWLEVKNTFQPKFSTETSTQMGLKNLSQRMILFTGNDIKISNDTDFYMVKLKLMTQ